MGGVSVVNPNVQNFVEQLRANQTTATQLAQQAIEAKRQAAEAAYQQGQLDIANKKFKEEQRQFDLTHQALSKLREVTYMQGMQELLSNPNKAAVTPGIKTEVTPAEKGTGGALYSPASGVGSASTQTYSGPGITDFQGNPTTVTGPTAENLTTREAGLKRIAMAPEVEAKMTEQKAAQQAETERQLKVGEQTTAREKMLADANNKAAMERERVTVAAQDRHNAALIQNQYRMALLPYQTLVTMGVQSPQEAAQMLTPEIDAVVKGNKSMKEVKNDWAGKGAPAIANQIQSSALAMGYGTPTDEQVKFKTSIKPLIDGLGVMEQYINMLPKTSGTGMGGKIKGIVGGASTMGDPQLASMEDVMHSQLPKYAMVVGGDKGQRLQKALLSPAEHGFLPDRYDTTAANVYRYNKLYDLIDQTVESALAGLPPVQRQLIKSDLGLTKYTTLNPDGSRPASAQLQPKSVQQPTLPANMPQAPQQPASFQPPTRLPIGGGKTNPQQPGGATKKQYLWTPQGVKEIQTGLPAGGQ